MMNTGRTRGFARKMQHLNAQGLNAMFGALVRTPHKWEEGRRRLCDRARTFWMFLEQTLCEDKSCTQAVAKNAARQASRGAGIPSPDTGAYCKVRKRLSVDDLAGIKPGGD